MRVSILGVFVGGLVDVVASFLLEIPLAAYVLLQNRDRAMSQLRPKPPGQECTLILSSGQSGCSSAYSARHSEAMSLRRSRVEMNG
jgi:hypothetical protein